MKKWIVLAVLLALGTIFSGCVMTVEEMYCLPRRSELYHNLQAAIDPAMKNLDHAAPLSGENQQTVQTADLDGDGVEEVILFARGGDEHPLKLLIFRQEEGQYSLFKTIESYGSDFDRVEYVQLDGQPGLELVVGRQLSDQLRGNLTAYRISGGHLEQMMNTGYHDFALCDLDSDGLEDLLVITGNEDTDWSVAVRYTLEQGNVERSAEVPLSEPVYQIRRIITGRISGGQEAVFISSTVDANSLVTDVFVLRGQSLTNLALETANGTGIKTLRNYYVYAEDIDQDGEVELPSLITMRSAGLQSLVGGEHLIRWFTLTSSGEEVEKAYTYHNHLEGWYMNLPAEYASRIAVQREEPNCYSFGLWDEKGVHLTTLWKIYVLTGDDRMAAAEAEGRLLLYKTETAAYAAGLEAGGEALGVTRGMLMDSFRLIQSSWYTGQK